MDERININKRKDIHKFVAVTNDPFCKQNQHILKDLFEKSLQAKHGSYSLYDIQSELLGAIIVANSACKTFLRRKKLFARALKSLTSVDTPLDRIKSAHKRMDDMDNSAAAARWFIGQLRSIGDGIAWWFFKYDRAALRLVAEHEFISVPNLDSGLLEEIKTFAALASQGKMVLINAITNFIRVGDITIYDKDKDSYQLIEVKAGGIQTARTIRQGKHMALVQDGLDSGSHALVGPTITKIKASGPLLTYVDVLESVMRKAESDLGASHVFGDYLSFAVFDTRKLKLLTEKRARRIREGTIKRLMSVISKKGDIPLPTMNSIFRMLHFSRILAPYTIFPIDNELRFGIMTGVLSIMTQLNVSGLARWLERRGWDVKIILPPKDFKIGKYTRMPALQVGRSSSPKICQIGLDILVVAAMELWKPESIERVAITAVNRGILERDCTIVFPNEGESAWD